MSECRKSNNLGSWKQVVDRVGEAVAYAALRQGTLPHIPHSWLKPGHGVKWPDSHEFLIQNTEWNTRWRDEFEVEVDEDTPDDAELTKWMHTSCTDERALPFQNVSMEDWRAIANGVQTGIPDGVDMTSPPAATAEPTAAERAVHPEYQGKAYDDTHAAVVKNIKTAMESWPKKSKATM